MNSKIAEYLNEQLAVENAVVDRLVTRIHETPISDLKAASREKAETNHESSGKNVSSN